MNRAQMADLFREFAAYLERRPEDDAPPTAPKARRKRVRLAHPARAHDSITPEEIATARRRAARRGIPL